MGRRWIAMFCCWILVTACGIALAQEPDPDVLLDGAPASPSGLTACDVQVGAGMGSGAPGTGGRAVALLLANTSAVASLAFDLTDTPDLLVATGCTALVPDFICTFVESAGRVEIEMTSLTLASIAVNVVARPIAELLYSVAAGAPSGTIALEALDAVVVDEFSQACAASAIAGSFLVTRCGDGIVDEGETCDDGNEANGDCCSSACQVEACDDGSACTADSCVPGSGCVFDPAPFNGTACGDPTSVPCNNSDICFAGVCEPGLSPVGTPCFDPFASACNAPDSCDGFGACNPNLAPAGSPCGDSTSNACNAPDACNGSGACLALHAPAGTPCDDPAAFCQTGEICNGLGMCAGGSNSSNCSDGIACTIDGCDEVADQCTYTPTDELCSDGLLCSGTETCDAQLGCKAGTPVDCPSDAIACTLDACVESTGLCGHVPQNAPCSDGLFCNGSEVCDPGVGCIKGRPPCPRRECFESNNSCEGPLPGNDNCRTGEPVAIGSLTPGTTVGATADQAPTCGTSNTSPGVWYAVVGNGNTLTASTCETVGTPPGSASYDTKISVYCLDCEFPTCIGGNDDVAGCSFHSAVSWCSQAGATYRVLVHGFGTATGAFNLSVSSGPTSCNQAIPCLPPSPVGACCLTSECPYSQGEQPISCLDNVSPDECAAAGGVYQGNDTNCIVTVNQIDAVVFPVVAIPSSSPAGVNSTITIPQSGTIADLNVDIGISHTWVSDLIITLTSPTGQSQVIWNQACDSTNNINATADDEGTTTACAPINAGPSDSVFFSPVQTGDGPLSVFDGQEFQGTWTLNVSNYISPKIGFLNRWSLHIIEGAGICADVGCPIPGDVGGNCDEDDDEDENGDARFLIETATEPSGTTPQELDGR